MMSKQARNEAMFDALLSKAFEEVAMEEIKELEKSDIPEVRLTAAHKREQRRFLRQIEKSKQKSARFSWNSVGVKIAACFLVCVFLGTAAVFAIPSARADFMKLITKSFDKYTSIQTVTDPIFGDMEYSFTYIPEGFELVEYEKNNSKSFKYETSDEKSYFNIKCSSGTISGLLKDSEDVEVTETTIKGNIAYIYDNGYGTVDIIWSYGENVFRLRGNISADILIRIADGVKKEK